LVISKMATKKIKMVVDELVTAEYDDPQAGKCKVYRERYGGLKVMRVSDDSTVYEREYDRKTAESALGEALKKARAKRVEQMKGIIAALKVPDDVEIVYEDRKNEPEVFRLLKREGEFEASVTISYKNRVYNGGFLYSHSKTNVPWIRSGPGYDIKDQRYGTVKTAVEKALPLLDEEIESQKRRQEKKYFEGFRDNRMKEIAEAHNYELEINRGRYNSVNYMFVKQVGTARVSVQVYYDKKKDTVTFGKPKVTYDGEHSFETFDAIIERLTE